MVRDVRLHREQARSTTLFATGGETSSIVMKNTVQLHEGTRLVVFFAGALFGMAVAVIAAEVYVMLLIP